MYEKSLSRAKRVRSGIVALFAMMIGTASVQSYTYVDLGAGNIPNFISNGHVCGTQSSTGLACYWGYSYYNYTWSGITQLYTVPLFPSSFGTYTSSVGLGCNEAAGHAYVVGYQNGVWNSIGGVTGFIYDMWTGALTPIQGGYNSNYVPTLAYAVSSAGTVCGWDDTYDEAFTCNLSGTSLVDYAAPNSSHVESKALANNANGIFGGVANWSVGGSSYAAIYDGGSWSHPGNLAGGTVFGINDNTSYAFCGEQGDGSGFYYDTGTSTLTTLGSSSVSAPAYSINTSGSVVGTTGGHAYICSGGGSTTMTDLNSLTSGGGFSTSTVHLTVAYGINNVGLIVGKCQVLTTDEDGGTSWVDHGFLLYP